MPQGVGYPPGGLDPLAQAARVAQGVPQPGITPEPTSVSRTAIGDPAEILALLKSGQFSAGTLLQFIAALVGANGQVPAEPDESPIESALMGDD